MIGFNYCEKIALLLKIHIYMLFLNEYTFFIVSTQNHLCYSSYKYFRSSCIKRL